MKGGKPADPEINRQSKEENQLQIQPTVTPGPEIEPGPQLIDQRRIYCIHVTNLGLKSRTFKLHWFALLKCVL